MTSEPTATEPPPQGVMPPTPVLQTERLIIVQTPGRELLVHARDARVRVLNVEDGIFIST